MSDEKTKPVKHMLDNELFECCRTIVVEQLGISPEDVTPEAKFVDDLDADSLDTVELVMAFEEAFDIEIPDDDAEKVVTVQDAVNYVRSRQ